VPRTIGELEEDVWSRPEPDVLVAERTALLVFDMLECYRAGIEPEAISATAALIDTCRDAGVRVCFARADHRADGAEFSRVVADTDRDFRPYGADHPQPRTPGHPAGSFGLQVLAELAPRPEDFDVPKHRWSAFHGTALDVMLRAQEIESVLVVGGSTHVGVASTVYAGRDLDYQMVVVSDCCTGHEEQRRFFVEKVFPRMCRVRTVEQVSAMLARGADR
jgi:nicotinamidase-related amidase